MEDEIRLDIGSEMNQGSTAQKRNVEMDENVPKMKTGRENKLPKGKKREEQETTIYKIPANIRVNFDYSDYTPFFDKNSDYAPCKVSFGPYYHGHESCQLTQDIKEKVVIHSLKGSNKKRRKRLNKKREESSNKKREDCERDLSAVLEALRDAYDKLDPVWTDDTRFLELMMYDGCFLLEILRALHSLAISDFSFLHSPICKVSGINARDMMEYYRHDMLLLENQIPMLVLEKLLSVQDNISPEKAKDCLHQWVVEWVHPTVKIQRKAKYLHVLDLYRHSLLSEEIISATTNFGSLCWNGFSCCIIIPWFCLCGPLVLKLWYLLFGRPRRATASQFSIPSATALKEGAGISVTKSETKGLMDISFRRRDLRLPQFTVDGATKSWLLNIMAFELLHKDILSKVTSYVYFMSSLLNDANDVSLLKSRGVIHSNLQNDRVVELFNRPSKDTLADPHIFFVKKYRIVGQKLTESFYKNKEWQKDLWQNYLRSPFGIVSVIAAFLLFVFTAIQTLYTVLGYYNSK